MPTRHRGVSYYLETEPYFSIVQIKRINYCQLYFNVVTVADTSNVAGMHVEAYYYWWAKADEHPLGKHKLGYLRLQERPNSVDPWVLWRKALKLFVPHHNKKLDSPLFEWLQPASQLRMAWPFYWDPSSRRLFQRTNSNHPAKTPANKSTSCIFFPLKNATMVDNMPDSAIPSPVLASDKHCTSGKQNDFASVPQWRLKGHVWGQQEITA
jgi:hypothetical protein